MTAKELAEELNGNEYGNEISRAEAQIANEYGLVVVFGYSDDNIEFEGAISDERGCFDGGIVHINRNGLCSPEDEGSRSIEAVWCDKELGAAWSYKTDIPHETFNIYEDGELFCVGIVFSLEDLK